MNAEFGKPPPDCDAEQFGEHPSVADGHCRCMTCARCGHHTANTLQGHYTGWCGGELREMHFCCRDPAFGCELEHRDPYMTVAEFAALPSEAHHAVWQAHAEKRVDVIPLGQVLQYRRDQVLALLRDLEAAR